MDNRSKSSRLGSPTTSISSGIGCRRAATCRRRCAAWRYRNRVVEPGRWAFPRSRIGSPKRLSADTSSPCWNRCSTRTPTVIGPLLANLFLHYVFDVWLERGFPGVPFERYADDIICHCRSECAALTLHQVLERRFTDCGLVLHPEKTKVVYCKDTNRQGEHAILQFDFLGYTFRPRLAKWRGGLFGVSYLPAASPKALKAIRQAIRGWSLQTRSDKALDDLARMFNPYIRGWINYYSHFYKSALYPTLRRIDAFLLRWARRKFKRLRQRPKALMRIAALYRIEADIRGRSADARRAIRQERSRPLVEALQPLLHEKLSLISQKTKLAEAIRYALSRWAGLCLFLEDGRIEIDNNAVERAIRPLALNRKNALFAGSDGGAEHWAVIASLIETCKLLGVEPHAYLADVITRIVNCHPQRRLDDLLPWVYPAMPQFKAVA